MHTALEICCSYNRKYCSNYSCLRFCESEAVMFFLYTDTGNVHMQLLFTENKHRKNVEELFKLNERLSFVLFYICKEYINPVF